MVIRCHLWRNTLTSKHGHCHVKSSCFKGSCRLVKILGRLFTKQCSQFETKSCQLSCDMGDYTAANLLSSRFGTGRLFWGQICQLFIACRDLCLFPVVQLFVKNEGLSEQRSPKSSRVFEVMDVRTLRVWRTWGTVSFAVHGRLLSRIILIWYDISQYTVSEDVRGICSGVIHPRIYQTCRLSEHFSAIRSVQWQLLPARPSYDSFFSMVRWPRVNIETVIFAVGTMVGRIDFVFVYCW